MSTRTSSRGVAAAALLLTTGVGLAALGRSRRRIELRGRVVVITGGGRGLGFAIARAFAKEGAKIAICGRDEEVLEGAEASLRRSGATVMSKPCDATDPAQVAELIGEVNARFGGIDVLVNNAGQCFVGPAVELRAEDVEYAIRNIFWLQYHPTMAVLPQMRRRGFGRIVNITSLGGRVPAPHQAAYSAGKFAATGWSEALASELRGEGVLVSTVAPPPLRDGAPLHVHFNGRTEDEFRWFTRMLTSSLSSTDTDRTARVVVDAARHGDPERAVSLGSWIASRAHGLAPNLVSHLLSAFNRALPAGGPPDARSGMRLGSEIAAASSDRIVRGLAAAAEEDARRYAPGGARLERREL